MDKLPYNPQITKNHHFVPSRFLEAWCNEGMLWVSVRDDKPFRQKPQNVAKVKGLYSQERMSAAEFILNFSDVVTLAKGLNPELVKIIMDSLVSNLLHDGIIKGHYTSEEFDLILSYIANSGLCSKEEALFLELVWKIYQCGNVPYEIQQFFEKHFVEGLEPFVTAVEQLAYPLIDMLRCGESCFTNDSEKREILFLYIAVQMFRIRKFVDMAECYGDINHKALKLSRPILMARTVNYLMQEWDNAMFGVVENETDLEFITGDNPICNMYAYEKVKYLDLYFPISPTKAIFMCKKDRASLYPEMCHMTNQYVHFLNQKLAGGSSDQVFASKRDTLEFGGYKPSFDVKDAVSRAKGQH